MSRRNRNQRGGSAAEPAAAAGDEARDEAGGFEEERDLVSVDRPSDERIRIEALKAAIETRAHGMPESKLIERAEIFERYIRGTAADASDDDGAADASDDDGAADAAESKDNAG